MSSEHTSTARASDDLRTVPVWFDFVPLDTDGQITYKFVMIADATDLDRWISDVYEVTERKTRMRRDHYKQTKRSVYDAIMERSSRPAGSDEPPTIDREAVKGFLANALSDTNWMLSAQDRTLWDQNGGLRFRLATEEEVRRACEMMMWSTNPEEEVAQGSDQSAGQTLFLLDSITMDRPLTEVRKPPSTLTKMWRKLRGTNGTLREWETSVPARMSFDLAEIVAEVNAVVLAEEGAKYRERRDELRQRAEQPDDEPECQSHQGGLRGLFVASRG